MYFSCNNTKHICVFFFTISGCLITAVSVAVNHERSLNLWPGVDGNSAAADYDINLFSFVLLSCRVHVHGAFLKDFWLKKGKAEICVWKCMSVCWSPSSYEWFYFKEPLYHVVSKRSRFKWTWCFQLVLSSGFIPPVGPHASTVLHITGVWTGYFVYISGVFFLFVSFSNIFIQLMDIGISCTSISIDILIFFKWMRR